MLVGGGPSGGLLGVVVGVAVLDLVGATRQSVLLIVAPLLAVSVLPLLGGSVLTGVGPLAWLAPATALVALSLALATVLRIEMAAGVAAGLWAALVMVPLALPHGSPSVFPPPTQRVWAGSAAVLLTVLVLRRADLDEEGFIR